MYLNHVLIKNVSVYIDVIHHMGFKFQLNIRMCLGKNKLFALHCLKK